MEVEAFIAWALDPVRTVEERYTTELLVQLGVQRWKSSRRIYGSIDAVIARNRERKLNPAYEPSYSEDDLRKAVEYLAVIQDFHPSADRPVRSLAPFRFLPTLESAVLSFAEPDGIDPLADLPHLRKLALGYAGSASHDNACADYTPLARCAALRELSLTFNVAWPNLRGLELLQQLEVLHLSGNLLAFPSGAVFPAVHTASLHCMPLGARAFADLPRLPACEFLTLRGAEKLDGIENLPRLRNLTIIGPFQSFAPLVALQNLTCLTVDFEHPGDQGKQPRDVSPLARLPRLHYFQIGHAHVLLDLPRDYSPLAEAPALHELVVQGCPPVAMEVSALNAGLPPWDDLFLAANPRPLEPLRFIVAPHAKHPRRESPHLAPGETGLIDTGLRACETRWVSRYITNLVSARLGHSDWGKAEAHAESHSFYLEIQSFEVVEKLAEIVEAARAGIAALRADYQAIVSISLRAAPPPLTPAQKQLEEKLAYERERWEFEQHQQERIEYLERLHQLDLLKQQGATIDPRKFSPPSGPHYPQLDDLKASEPPDEPLVDAGDDGDDEGDVALATDPDPPPLFDDEHPLAENYRLYGTLTVSEVWFSARSRGLASHLLQREPDLEIPEETAQQ